MATFIDEWNNFKNPPANPINNILSGLLAAGGVGLALPALGGWLSGLGAEATAAAGSQLAPTIGAGTGAGMGAATLASTVPAVATAAEIPWWASGATNLGSALQSAGNLGSLTGLMNAAKAGIGAAQTGQVGNAILTPVLSTLQSIGENETKAQLTQRWIDADPERKKVYVVGPAGELLQIKKDKTVFTKKEIDEMVYNGGKVLTGAEFAKLSKKDKVGFAIVDTEEGVRYARKAPSILSTVVDPTTGDTITTWSNGKTTRTGKRSTGVSEKDWQDSLDTVNKMNQSIFTLDKAQDVFSGIQLQAAKEGWSKGKYNAVKGLVQQRFPKGSGTVIKLSDGTTVSL